MKGSVTKNALSALLVVGTFAFSGQAAATLYTYSAFGVDFTIDATGGASSFTLGIVGAASTTNAEWDNANFLGALGFKDLGIDFSAAGVSASMTSSPAGTWNYIQGEINAQGCQDPSGEKGAICFSSPLPPGSALAVTDNMLFTVAITGDTLDIGPLGPHLKLQFLSGLGTTTQCHGNPRVCDTFYSDKEGSLLSQNLPPGTTKVPEPNSGTLALSGLALLGFAMWSRRRSATSS